MKNMALNIPDWLRKSAVYQINLRTFCNEGTINAAKDELPFLKQLGFKIIYFCPIFQEDDSCDKTFWSKRQIASKTENPKNPYRISNYFRVDSEYGSMSDLRNFVKSAHLLGMKVLLDLVYMHIAPNAEIIKYHPEFVKQNADGSFQLTEYNFPLLDFKSTGLREYLWCNMCYLIGEVGVDGFRCDVGDAVPDDFWIEGRRRIKAIKPDAVLINEGFKFHRMATSFDSCYAVNWHEELYKVFSGEITAAKMIENEKKRLATVPTNGLLLRDIDNHDTVTDWKLRTEVLAGNDGMELIEVINYTIAGIPMVYCGNELADDTKINMFANRYHKGDFNATDRQNQKNSPISIRRQELIKKLNLLLSEKDAMSSTFSEWIETGNENIVAFKNSDNIEEIIFMGNFSKVQAHFTNKFKDCKILLKNNAEFDADGVTFNEYGYILCSIRL